MKTKLLLTLLLFFLATLINAQGIYNNGGKIVIGAGAVVYVNGSGGNFRNESSGGNGAVLLSGKLVLKGNLTNNVVSADVFTAPAAGSEVVLAGSAAQTLGGSTTATFQFDKLTLNNSNGLTLGRSVRVNNILNFQSGLITTGTNTLTIGLSGTISGSSSTTYVNGKMGREIGLAGSDFTFPIGKGGNYRPLAINFSSLTGTSTVLAEQIESLMPGTAPSNVTIFPDRYWQITQSGGSNLAYTLILDGTGFTTSAIKKMIKGDGTTNTDYDVTYASPYFINSSPFNSFSNFGIGEYCVGQTVIFPAILPATYGDAPFTVTATGGASGNPVIFSSSDPTVATCTGTNGSTITIIKAGSCTISAIQAGDAIYCQGRTDRVLTVNPKPITVTADAGQTKVYGTSDPAAFTYSWSPSLIGTDIITGSMGRTAGENAGNYPYTLGSLTAGSNYTLTVSPSPVFTITPKPLTPVVTASSKCYDGNANATLTSQTLTGVIAPDVVTLSVTSAAFDNAGSGTGKTVTASGLSLGGAGSSNYSLAAATANTTADIYALPVPVITGFSAVCLASTGNVYSTETGKSNYIWTVSSGGSITSGGGTSDNSVTITWNTTGAQTVGVVYTDSHGCTAGTATVKDVSVVPLPVPSLSGPASACISHTGNVYTTDAGKANYIWTVSPGGTITAGGTAADNSVTVTWTTAGAQTVSINYTVGASCTAASPTVKAVTVNPSPVPTLSGPTDVCSSSGHIYTTQAGMSSYVWNISSGGSITSGGTSSDNTATVTWNTSGAQTISVNYQNADGCQGAAPGVQNVTVKASPVPTISGPATVCGASSGVTYSTEAGKSNYSWTLSSGGSITAGSGTSAITIVWSNPGTHTITVNYTDVNGCSALTPTSKTVTVGPYPVVSLSGPATPCLGHTGKVYTTEAGKSNYSWSVSSGGTVTSGGTSADNSVTVTWNTAGAQTVSANYQNEYGCSAVSPTTQNITVLSAPAPSISGPSLVCSGVAGNVYSTLAGQSNYIWTVSAGGTVTSGGGLTNNTVTVTWAASGTVSVNYQNSDGCEGASPGTQNVTVSTSGQVNQPASQVVCNGNSTTAVTFTTTNSGGTTTYSWTNSDPGIGIAGSGTGNIGSFTAINAGTSPVVATITVTPTFTNGSVGCAGPSKTFTITVNPTGQVNQPADQVVCNGSATLVTFATVNTGGTTNYAWTNSNPGIGIAGSGNGNIGSFTAINTGTTPVVATITVTPTFTNGSVGCAGPSKTLTITVNPSGQVNQPTDQIVCNNNTTTAVSFGTLNTGGSTTYSWTNSNPGIGIAGSGTGNIGSFTAINTGTSPVVATITVTPTFTNGSVGCAGPSKTFTITVNPTGQVNQPADQVVCNGATTSVTFGTLNTGGTTTYSWINSNPGIGIAGSGTGNIGSFNAINTGTSPVIATITVTPTFTNASVGCAGPSKTFTITVNPTGQVNQPADQVVCNGSATSVTFATLNTGGTTTYSWTNSNPGIGIGGSGAGNISFTAINTGTSPVVATITVTPTFTNGSVGCLGASKTFTIIVNPGGQVNQPADQVVCNSGSTTAVAFGTINMGGTTTYSWTNSNPGIGIAGSGNGNIGSFTAINTGTSPLVATITVTPTFTNGSVGCAGSSKTFTITVNPTGQVNQPADQVVCNSGSTTAVTFGTINTGGTTTYSWTNSNPGIGIQGSGNGNIGSFTAINTGTSPVVATFVVSPTFNNGSVGCAGPSKTFTITVNPSGQVNQSTDQLVCNNSPTTPVIFGTVNTGGSTTYSWTNSNPGIGMGGSGNGNIGSFTAINTGTSPLVATITVTPTFTNGSVGCTGPSKTFTITVNPTGQVTQPVDQVVCNSGSTAAVIFGTTNTGGTTTYTWTNSNPGIGIPGSGNGNIGSFTAINTGTSPVVATFVVTPTFTNGSVGCAGPSKTFTITVNPTGQVTQPADQIVCNGSATTVSFATVNTGGTTTYAWTNSNPGIGIGGSGTGNISFTAINNGSSPVTASFTVTPTFTNGAVGCTGPSKTFIIIVNPSGEVEQPSNQSVCHNTSTSPVIFSTTNTGGSTSYSWINSNPGIGIAGSGTGNIPAFTATNAGTTPVVATFSVTPTFTNGGVSCSGPTKTFTITVNPLPVPTISGITNMCPNSGNYDYTTEGNMWNYQWNVSSGGILDWGQGTNYISVIWTTPGTQSVSVSYINPYGCSTATPTVLTVIVNPVPGNSGPITGQAAVCPGTTGVVYSVAPIANAVTYVWTLPFGSSVASGAGTNSITVDFSNNALSGSISVMGNNLCGNGIASSFPITINPVPPAPTISASGYILTSSAVTGNQWYHDGLAIVGATSQTYTVPVNQPGWYWTEFTQSGCTSDTSNHIYIQGVGIGESSSGKFSIYPIPNQGRFNASIYWPVRSMFNISIYNELGAMIFQKTDIDVNGQITEPVELLNAPPGIYTVVFTTAGYNVVRKIIISD